MKTTTHSWTIYICEPGFEERQQTVTNDRMLLGRSDDCDIVLQDQFVSSRHLTVRPMGDDLYHIKDLGSSNGTFVDGSRVRDTYVKKGSQLLLGRTTVFIGEKPQDYSSNPATSTVSIDTDIIYKNDSSGPATGRPHSDGIKELQEIADRVCDLCVTEEKIVHMLRHLRQLTRSTFCLIVRKGNTLYSSQNQDHGEGIYTPIFSIVKHVETSKVPFCSHDLDTSELSNDERTMKVKAVLCVPLMHNQQSFGVLYIDRRSPTEKNIDRRWSAQDQNLTSIINTFIAVLLFNEQLKNDLRKEIGLRTALQRYVSPQIVQQIMQQEQQTTLGGKEVKASILFSDIRGFTKFSSDMEPGKLITQLNEYFSLMANVIIAHGGYLDKFIGDAIMAVFGVPKTAVDDSCRAIKAATEMQSRLNQINKEWQSRNWQALSMGIGINTGSVVSGNIGSTQRMEYTVLGDSVNVASRLCSVAKGGQVIVSESTLSGNENVFTVSEVDLPKLKGKEESTMRAFHVVANKESH